MLAAPVGGFLLQVQGHGVKILLQLLKGCKVVEHAGDDLTIRCADVELVIHPFVPALCRQPAGIAEIGQMT